MPKGGKGYLLIDNAFGPREEYNTLTCCHCNRVVLLNPLRTRERNRCVKCDAYVCDTPGCVLECNPIQESLELALHYLDKPEPWLLRGPNGELLYPQELRDQRRIH